jgi:hypothetical protein
MPDSDNVNGYSKKEGKHPLEYFIAVLTFIATAFAVYYTREQWLTAVRSASCAHRCDGFAYEESIGKIPAYDFRAQEYCSGASTKILSSVR